MSLRGPLPKKIEILKDGKLLCRRHLIFNIQYSIFNSEALGGEVRTVDLQVIVV